MLAVLVFMLDRITKGLVVANVPLNTEFAAIDHAVWIAHVQNEGAAFGLAPVAPSVFLAVSVAVAIGLVYYVATRDVAPIAGAMLGLVLGGTLGNAYDRLLHGGSVTDFIALHFWPVFNVADSAISVGVAAILVTYLLRRSPRPG
jgi:signal peptidase II